MWKGRFKEDTARVVQEFTQSLDLDWRMARHDIYGSIAHVRMLGETGILDKRECDKIEDGLLKVLSEIQSGKFKPEIELEDVHMNIEHRLTQLEPLGAKLHTARSRNDQTAVTVRLYLRDRLLNLGENFINLLKAVLALAEKNKLVIVSGYTHLQQAQPISFAHYLLAWFEAFSRDYERLKFALNALNECPLGAGALAGSRSLSLGKMPVCGCVIVSSTCTPSIFIFSYIIIIVYKYNAESYTFRRHKSTNMRRTSGEWTVKTPYISCFAPV